MIGRVWLACCYLGNGLMDLLFGPEEPFEYESRTSTRPRR